MGRDTRAKGASRRGRRALPVVGLIGAALLVALYRRVLSIPQHPSWPPPPDAVTPEGAEAAVEASPAPLRFAWSTAATIEPWVDGTAFFPRIFKDVEAATSSVHILMFGWREGAVGTRMAELLNRKLAEGVEVRVLVDRLGLQALRGGARDVHRSRLGGRGDRRQRLLAARPVRPLP